MTFAASQWVSSTADHTIALVYHTRDHSVLTPCGIGPLRPRSLEERARYEIQQGASEAETAFVCHPLCYKALWVVCNHRVVEFSQAEGTAVVWMLAYKAEASMNPVTNRACFPARDLCALVDVATKHFAKFSKLCARGGFDERVPIEGRLRRESQDRYLGGKPGVWWGIHTTGLPIGRLNQIYT